MITVNDWVIDYIDKIYERRGFNLAEITSSTWFPLQVEGWKRLVVKTGINADKNMADDIAFEFAAIPCYKAERVYEEFAVFVSKRPRSVRVHQEQKHMDSLVWKPCGICGGLGVLIVPVTRTKGGQTINMASTFRCECANSLKYLGVEQASPEMMTWGRKQERIADERHAEWIRLQGGDITRDSETRLLTIARNALRKYKNVTPFILNPTVKESVAFQEKTYDQTEALNSW